MKKQTSLQVLIAASFLVMLLVGLAQADWQQVGGAGFSPAAAFFTSIAIDSNGTPYVAYVDVTNNRKASMMKFSGGTWQQVGTAGFTADQASYISLAIDSSGTPYVAYKDAANVYKASVMKFNGTSWQQVGAAGFSDGTGDYISLAIDSSGIPYVAYQDWGNSGKVSVMKFSSGSWQPVGAAGFSAGEAYYTSLAINSSGTPYVAYRDTINSNKVSVMLFNSTTSTWEQVGIDGFSAGQADYISLAIDSSGTPYVAYKDFGNSYKASVMRFNGTSWQQVGMAGFSASAANYISLAIDSSDTPYIAYIDYFNSSKASVMKFNGTSWQQVGTAGFSAGAADFTSLAIDRSGTPYVAYIDYSNSDKASVMRHPVTCSVGRSLPANTWLMTAPDCVPDPVGIYDQYSPGISGMYGTNWIGWKWNAATQTYPAAMVAADPLVPGVGNWMYSTNAGTVRMTSGASTPTEDCTAYGSTGQCFVIDLAIPPAAQTRWNFVGHPFAYAVPWADVKIAANNGSWTIYSPSGAETAGYVSKTFHSWNGSTYDSKDDVTLGQIGALKSQGAVWIRSLAGSSGLTGLKLLIPAQ